MKIKTIILYFLSSIWAPFGFVVNAQSMYPSLPTSIYYNMDTSKIILGEDQITRTSYSGVEIARIFDGSWEPDSAMLAIPYEDVPCTKNEIVTLPLLEINSRELDGLISEIIDKTISEGYSYSPDTVISRGIVFNIRFYYDRNSQQKNLMMKIDVLSNYYLGTNFKYNKRNYSGSNIYCCYHKGILGIVTFSDDIDASYVKSLFAETEQNVSLHLYKKQRQKIDSDLGSPIKDVHSTNYGLYRKYVLQNNKWVIGD